jgi:hypothetical protein
MAKRYTMNETDCHEENTLLNITHETDRTAGLSVFFPVDHVRYGGGYAAVFNCSESERIRG